MGKLHLKSFISGIIVASLVTMVVVASAEGIIKTITVAENSIHVTVDGATLTAPNFVYEGRTYIQMRDFSNALGMNLSWDKLNNTAVLVTNNTSALLPNKDIEDSLAVSPSPTPTVEVVLPTPTPIESPAPAPTPIATPAPTPDNSAYIAAKSAQYENEIATLEAELRNIEAERNVRILTANGWEWTYNQTTWNNCNARLTSKKNDYAVWKSLWL